MSHPLKRRRNGFSLIELLIFLAIIGILAAIVLVGVLNARTRAVDARIRNDIAQLRWEAEIAYDSQNASFLNWPAFPTVSTNVDIILTDIDEALGQPNAATVRDSDANSYCVSAPLATDANKHYCVDARGVFIEANSACPAAPPFACPTS